MGKPYFSVIMPLYNHADYVQEAIESVLSQSFEDFELIVCNDGSVDESLEIVSNVRDSRVRIINKPNGGTASALNACLLESTGHYICWLSSDDTFAENKLKSHYIHHSAHPESELSLTNFGYIRDGVKSKPDQLPVESNLRLIQFVFGNYVNGLSVCAKKELYLLYGLFNNRYRYAHDVERWFSFFKYKEPVYIAGTEQNYTRLGTGNTANADLLGQLDVLKILFNNLQERGLRCFSPKTEEKEIFSLEYLALICARLFDKNNLFFQFHMSRLLAELVAQSMQKENIHHHLPALMSFYGASVDEAARLVSTYLAEVNEIIIKEKTLPELSFVEHVVQLKNTVVSDDVRKILLRFLHEGF